MTLLIIVLHILIDGLCGLAVLQRIEKEEWQIFTFIKAVAIGMFLETMVLTIFHFVGISILIGFIIFASLTLGHFLLNLKTLKQELSWRDPLLKKRLSVWEYLLLIFIGEKIAWSLYNLYRLPIYFDDALNHWSGRGKAMLTGVNWSWDPESIYFLGKAFGHMEYPLFISIWRAVNSALLGGGNGASERADGLIMAIFVAFTIMVWIFQRTGSRWLGLAGASIICAMPLQIWHMTAGYAELFIQAYLIFAMWSIMNDKYVLAGIFTAALIWSKNEGFIIFLPCLLLCISFRLLMDKETTISNKIKSFFKYNAAWLVAIAPWIIFKIINGVGFTIPGNKELGYVDGAMIKMAKAMFDAPSSSIFWIFIFISLVVGIRVIIKDRELFILTIGALFLLAMLTFVFTCTGAYIFLENQMTIHRSLMQIAPIFIVLVVITLGKGSVKNLFDID